MRYSTLILAASLLALAFTTPASAVVDAKIHVTWQFDASETAPFSYPKSWSRCTIEVPADATAGDAFDIAVATPDCGVTAYRISTFDLGDGPVRFVDEVNGAPTACANDPAGLVFACRFWALYQNNFASTTGIDETLVNDGDVLGFNYELSAWPVSVPNPATVYWLAGLDYSPALVA